MLIDVSDTNNDVCDSILFNSEIDYGTVEKSKKIFKESYVERETPSEPKIKTELKLVAH